MDLGLSGKVAVITGGSVGIGLAVARGLAAEGVHLLIAARDGARAERRGRRASPASTASRPAPSRRRRDGRRLRRRLIAAAESAFGGADILINNAGTGSNETILEAPDDEVAVLLGPARHGRGPPRARPRPVDEPPRRRRRPQQRLDLRHPAALVRADLQHDQGGAGDVLQEPRQRADPAQHPRQRAQPRPRPHPRLDQDRDAADRRQRRRPGRTTSHDIAAQNAPIKRFATPEEVASFFVFLCSDKASYSVGSTYYVDGGMLRTIA